MSSHLLLRCWSSRRRALTLVNTQERSWNVFHRRVVLQRLLHRDLHSVRRAIPMARAELQVFVTTQRWHGHKHSHGPFDDEEETAEERAVRLKLSAKDVRAANRITWAGIWVNMVLSGLKGVAGVAFHSSGLLADAAHSMSDLVSDFVTLLSLKYCARPPDATQPYGYGKYETMGALSVSLLLVGGSLGIIVHSIDTLLVVMEPVTAQEVVEMVEHLDIHAIKAVDGMAKSAHSHAHGLTMHPAALAIAAMSVAAKEALFRTTINIGRRVHSSVLIANAWHHRSDAITSIVAMGGIGLSLAGFPIFDPLAGIAVGGIVLKMGAEMGWESTKELCDAKLPEKIIASLNKAASDVVRNSNREVLQVCQLRCRKVGRYIYVDLTLVLNDACDVHRAIEWKRKVKDAMKNQVPRVKDIVVEIATPEQLSAMTVEKKPDN